MSKLAAYFIGLVTLAFLCYLFLGIYWLFAPRYRERTDAFEDTWDPYRLYKSANTTLPPVGGAVRHYTSLLDDGPVTLRCSSCAVVSSSGFLLGKEAGQAIDRHPCVIRMNMAPTEGYQRDVGNRTTLRVMNFLMIGLRPEELPPGTMVMVWGLFRRSVYLEKARNLTARLSTGSTFYGQTVEGEAEASALFTKETGQPLGGTYSWLSTGWFALMIAIDICQEIHVYGMVTSDYCTHNPQKSVPYHYYKSHYFKNRGTECSAYQRAETNKKGDHRFMTEKAIFARWALRYNISFHNPEWKLNENKVLAKLETPFFKNLKRRPS